MKTILSICDYSGSWSRPYLKDYRVVRVDIKHSGRTVAKDGGENWGMSVHEFYLFCLENPNYFGEVVGILMAPPCTDFASSGAQWWKDKDADGRTAASIEIVTDCLALVDLFKPRFWALENPKGRLQKCVPQLGKYRLAFDPCDYAGYADDPQSNAYTKFTCLWGEFNIPEQDWVEPKYIYGKGGKRGSAMWANLGGKSERVKELRSITPQGFARAFYEANP